MYVRQSMVEASPSFLPPTSRDDGVVCGLGD